MAVVGFNEEEGAFLAGVAAASLTRSNLVGFLGGSMLSANHKLEDGYARGVQYINMTEGRGVKILASYAGVTEKAAGDADKGKELAINLFWAGSDVIFSETGNMAAGAAQAASENRKIMLSNDVGLMQKLPWNVYGAMVKNYENIVYDLIKKSFSSEFAAGKKFYGLADGAVDLVPSQAAPREISDKLEAVKGQLIKGQIKINSIQLNKELVTQVNSMPVDLNKPQPSQRRPAQQTPGSGTTGSGINQDGRPGQDQGTPVEPNPGNGTGQPPDEQGTGGTGQETGQETGNVPVNEGSSGQGPEPNGSIPPVMPGT